MATIDATREQVLREIYDAFEARDARRVEQFIDGEFEFRPVTAMRLGRTEPYRGAGGMEQYLLDAARVWVELRITPQSFEQTGDCVLVTGRVWARDAESLTDSPAAWIWEFDGDRPVSCEVYVGTEDARNYFDGLGDGR